MDRKHLLDKLDEIIYVSCTENHELLYINRAGCEFFGKTREELVGQKCYQVIQKRAEPCPFCNNGQLSREEFCVWENVAQGRTFLRKDMLIQWQGRDARLEIAQDITEKEQLSRRTQEALAMRETLIQCVHSLSSRETPLKERVNHVLQLTGEFYQADRAYVFTLNEKQGTWCNSYEWCGPEAAPVINALQEVPGENIAPWVEEFKREGRVFIQDTEDIAQSQPDVYHDLSAQGVHSLLAAPYVIKGKVVSFIGVDNPKVCTGEHEFLLPIINFLTSEIKNERMLQEIRFMQGCDIMTGLLNRSSYVQAMDTINTWKLESMGYVALDINNLRSVNEQEGQQEGNKLIRQIAGLLTEIFQQAKIFRVGGGEFAVLYPNVEKDELKKLVERLRERVHQPNGICLAAVSWMWENTHIDLYEMALQADNKQARWKSRYYAWLRTAYHLSPKSVTGGEAMRFMESYQTFLKRDCDLLLQVDLGEDKVDVGYVREDNVYRIPEKEDILSGSFDFFKQFCATTQDEERFDQIFTTQVLDDLYVGKEMILDCKFHCVGTDNSVYWTVLRAQSGLEDRGDGTLYPCMILSLENLQRSFYMMNEASFDPVTGLFSWSYFCRRLDFQLKNHTAAQGRHAVIRANIRDFHLVADVYGCEAGDVILRKVGIILKQCVHKDALVCRHYADSYYIAQCFQDASEIERLLDQVERLLAGVTDFPVIMTFGVCWEEKGLGEDAQRLCIQADHAHNRCKQQVGRRVTYYDGEIRQSTMMEARMLAEQDEALRAGQFSLYLQPKVDSRTEKIVGAEALVRWKHPKYGNISPAQFVPLFERSQTMQKVDWYVWEELCKMLRRDLDSQVPTVPVSLNMSKLHLYEKDFLRRFIQLIDSYGLPHSLIEVEITETLYTSNHNQLNGVAHQLRSAGFSVAIDDFGTGDSSLNMMWKTKVDVLKLDRVFFMELERDQPSGIIVRHIVAMAHDLEMTLVAEGVENVEQVEFLKQLDCCVIQGYYYYQPMPMEDFEQLMREQGDGMAAAN